MVLVWLWFPVRARVGGGPPAEPHREAFPCQFCCAEPWEFLAEDSAEVFGCSDCPAKQTRKIRPKLWQKLCPDCPPQKGKLRSKLRLSDPTEIPPPPHRETSVAIPLLHCVSCGIADYRCYTPTSFRKNGLSQSKERPNKGYRRKSLPKMRKKTKHWNVTTPTPSVCVCVCFWVIFTIKLGRLEMLIFFWPTDWAYGHVCMCTYIYMLWSYYLGQVWPFQVLLSGPSRCYYLGQVVF